MDLELVNMWLGALLDVRSEDVYRMKGILSVEGFPERYVFQGVHALFSGEAAAPWRRGEERRSKMVFIGRGLDPELLRAGFDECVVAEDGVAKGRRKLAEHGRGAGERGEESGVVDV
jgi:G3E family GTPase